MAPKHRPTQKRKSNKNLLLLAIAAVAIIVIAVGAYALLGQPANPTPTPTPTPSPTASPTASPSSSPNASQDPLYTNPTKVQLQTTAGNITLELRSDKPITTTNFINLVEAGKYDGTTFHRTMADFMIQGGMISGSTASIQDEIGSSNRNVPYTIAMAKTAQPNSATSQFFINVADNGNKPIDQQGTLFDETYTVFGRVLEGRNVVDQIANAAVSANPYTGEPSVPVHAVTITKATIIT